MKLVIGHQPRQDVQEIRQRDKAAKLRGKVGTQVLFAGNDFRLDGHAPFDDIDDVFQIVAQKRIALATRLEGFKFGRKEGRRRNQIDRSTARQDQTRCRGCRQRQMGASGETSRLKPRNVNGFSSAW